jgi:hypothetical protein
MMLWLGTMLLSAVPIPGTVHGQRSGSSCLDSCRADRRPTTEGVGQQLTGALQYAGLLDAIR